MQKPFADRAEIQEQDDTLEITISKRRNWFAVIMQTFSLIFWTLLTVYFVNGTVGDPSNLPVLLFFLLTFGSFTVFMFYLFLYVTFGEEKLVFTGNSISIALILLKFKRKRIYNLLYLSRLRVLQITESSFSTGNWPSLAFDYGSRTVRFGRGMDEAEAAQILERVIAKFPQYRSSSAVGSS